VLLYRALVVELIDILVDHALRVRVEQVNLVLVSTLSQATATFKAGAGGLVGRFCADAGQNCSLYRAVFVIKRVVFGDALHECGWLCTVLVCQLGVGILI